MATGWIIAVSIILFIDCIVLMAAVLLQQDKNAGLSGAISGGNTDTYFSRNKNRTIEGKLNLITKICGGIFVVLSLVLYYMINW